MEKPLVSVIVPNYNYATFLPQRMKSILNQSFSNFELILLDDASSDMSVEILKNYAKIDNRITCVFVNKKNSGSPFKQWKKGLEIAQGTYIWIAESDDYADNSFLEETVALLEQHPKAVYCKTGSYLVNEMGRILKKNMDHWPKDQLNSSIKYRCFSGIDYVVEKMYWKNYIYNASGVLFRREAFLKLDSCAWDSMLYCGDWYFWTMLAIHGDILEIYERLNFFRQHPVSVTADSKRNELTYINCMKECMHITLAVEQHFPINFWQRWFCYGNYYRLFKKERISLEGKKELIAGLRHMCKNPSLAYWMIGITRLLKKTTLSFRSKKAV